MRGLIQKETFIRLGKVFALSGLPFLILLGATGCSATRVDTDLVVMDQVKIVTKDSGHRSVYVSNKNGKVRIVLEPMLDVADSERQVAGIQGIIPGVGNEGASENSSQVAIGLGGISPEVLIASILMYRAAEMSFNLEADENLSKEIYFRFLKTIEKVAKYSQVGTPPVNGNDSEDDEDENDYECSSFESDDSENDDNQDSEETDSD